jgi:hypothetical protein
MEAMMKFASKVAFPENFFEIAQQCILEVAGMLPLDKQEEGGQSGYLTCLITDPSKSVNWVEGEIKQEKIGTNCGPQELFRRRNSGEKVLRLSWNPMHWLSWESRDEDNKFWGGAVRLTAWLIVGFSGMPQEADEAAILYLGVRTGLCTLAYANRLAAISNNDYWRQLKEKHSLLRG